MTTFGGGSAAVIAGHDEQPFDDEEGPRVREADCEAPTVCGDCGSVYPISHDRCHSAFLGKYESFRWIKSLEFDCHCIVP